MTKWAKIWQKVHNYNWNHTVFAPFFQSLEPSVKHNFQMSRANLASTRDANYCISETALYSMPKWNLGRWNIFVSKMCIFRISRNLWFYTCNWFFFEIHKRKINIPKKKWNFFFLKSIMILGYALKINLKCASFKGCTATTNIQWSMKKHIIIDALIKSAKSI